MHDKIKQLLSDIQAGDFKSIARGITLVENEMEGYEDLLFVLPHADAVKVLGITGPPGAGKSTLVNALLKHWISQGKKIAVLAVDPSSPFNYGALLGDRIRMSEFYNHPEVFIRSLASRGALGGLNKKMIEITDVLKTAPFDLIIVETVGVGQSEVEIAGLADCTVVALVPEAGDEVQMIKAGILEIADLFVVNKADRESAEALYRNLKILVHEKAEGDDEIPVIKTIATTGEGIEELAAGILSFLSKGNSQPQKKLQLLSQRCWELIQQEKMKSFSKQALREALEKASKQAGFNLYTFVRTYEG